MDVTHSNQQSAAVAVTTHQQATATTTTPVSNNTACTHPTNRTAMLPQAFHTQLLGNKHIVVRASWRQTPQRRQTQLQQTLTTLTQHFLYAANHHSRSMTTSKQ